MANADIETPEKFIDAHPLFPNTLANTPVAEEFKIQEKRANAAKLCYTILGQYGLAAAFLTLSAVIYTVTIEHWLFEGPKILAPSEHIIFKLVFLFVGLSGGAAQIYLLVGPVKKSWLNARFHAERLRSLKFQAFQEAACVGDEGALTFTGRALGDLAVELTDATAARHNFEPDVAMAEPCGGGAISGESLAQLKRAYRKLRVERQLAFAIGEIKRINEERKLPTSASEIAFWAGAGLAYLDAIVGFVEAPGSSSPLRPILHCVTLELFIGSALLFVLGLGAQLRFRAGALRGLSRAYVARKRET